MLLLPFETIWNFAVVVRSLALIVPTSVALLGEAFESILIAPLVVALGSVPTA